MEAEIDMLFPINSFVLFLKVPLEVTLRSRRMVEVSSQLSSQESIIHYQRQNKMVINRERERERESSLEELGKRDEKSLKVLNSNKKIIC